MHSTLTALIDMKGNSISNLNIDDGLTNAILFIDLKKEFDTKSMTMRSFCQNWSCMGLKVQVLIFFENHDLSDRTQVTVINDVNSETSYLR